MEIGSVTSKGFFEASRGQEGKNSSRAKIVFTSAAEIGKALAARKINVDGVTIELSDEAMQALSRERDQYLKDRDAENARYVAEFNSYVARQQAEAGQDMAEDMAKALETARRIADGHIVPAIDEKKLMEYDFELYQVAKSAAMLHDMEEKRKKDKTLYGEEAEREYTDPEEETTPVQKFGVEVEVSLEGAGEVTAVSEGPADSLG